MEMSLHKDCTKMVNGWVVNAEGIVPKEEFKWVTVTSTLALQEKLFNTHVLLFRH